MSTETPETTLRTLRPEDVPDELVAMLERAIYSMPRIELTRTIARACLAAVLPAHEAMVRADERRKAIEEIKAKRDAIECKCADDLILRSGLWLAARILEGERP